MAKWVNVIFISKDMAVSCGITNESLLNILNDSDWSNLELLFADGGLETFRKMKDIDDLYIHIHFEIKEVGDSPIQTPKG